MNDLEWLNQNLRSIHRVRSNGESEDEGMLVCDMDLDGHFTVQVKCSDLTELLAKCRRYEELKLRHAADGSLESEKHDIATLVGGRTLLTHKKENCKGEFCCIHNPSDHHMKDWHQNWRGDRGMMERMCRHGIGHPDWDDLSKDRTHGCDGCCGELWKPIPGFKDRYEVSNHGRVKSLAKKHGFGRSKERILKPRPNGRGYFRVGLGAGVDRYIQRLVLEAFVGPCPKDMGACHENGDKSDNWIGNLRWDTSAANEADSARLGTKPIGSSHKNSKLSENDVRSIRRHLKANVGLPAIAMKFGVHKATIWDIKHGKTWKHLV